MNTVFSIIHELIYRLKNKEENNRTNNRNKTTTVCLMSSNGRLEKILITHLLWPVNIPNEHTFPKGILPESIAITF